MKKNGFTLFISIVVTGTLLLIATSIINVAVKEAFITGAARESQYAFYAADTGIECALFWDVKNMTGISAFSTTTGAVINCNKDDNNLANEWVVGGSYTSIINQITFLPDPYCAIVTVNKGLDGSTRIESQGYNTCDTNNPRRVERAVRVTY
ncbi:MAG: pilus assembly PilX N-terminal domain-containing protein [Patescibacteria group bacterium]